MRKKVTVLIDNNHRELPLYENIDEVTSESTLTVESATVFWDYNNVISGVNDTFIHNGNTITVPEGYWTQSMLKKIRNGCVVRVDTSNNSTYYDSIAQFFINENGSGGFSVYSSHASYNIDLGSFGTLLGFDKNFLLPPQKRKLSQNPADLNRGLKYITVSCDIVDYSKNIDTDGGRSNVIATIPVPRDIDLKRSTTQHYIDPESSGGILLENGCYNRLVFDVNTNIGPTAIGSILLELCINYK